MAIKRRYYDTLEGYLKWRSGIFLRQTFPFNVNGPSAAQVMLDWESSGITPVDSCEPELLADYVQGKRSRDWHISEWREGIEMKLFLAEEFLGSLGCTEENFEGIFGHAPRPEIMEIVNRI